MGIYASVLDEEGRGRAEREGRVKKAKRVTEFSNLFLAAICIVEVAQVCSIQGQNSLILSKTNLFLFNLFVKWNL